MKSYLFWLCTILALAGGIFAGWVDFNNDEVQAAVLVILVVTFLTGSIKPGKAWLWAIIVALCLPSVYLLATQLGYQPVSPPSPGWYASFDCAYPSIHRCLYGSISKI